jgi:hypothetical protein
MERYMEEYDSFNKYIIYDRWKGGVGDFVAFFTYTLKLCIANSIRMYYLPNDEGLLLDKYIKLRYSKMYITQEKIDEIKKDNGNSIRNIIHIDQLKNLSPNVYYTFGPLNLYQYYTMDRFGTRRGRRGALMINFNLDKVFVFSEEVIKNVPDVFKSEMEYIAIHLRLGDACIIPGNDSDDKRPYNLKKIKNFINKNKDKNILFLCDSPEYLDSINDEVNENENGNGNGNGNGNVITTGFEITHTDYDINRTDLRTLNTLTEYYLLTNSKEIYLGSYSGFSITASCFKNVPICDIDDLEGLDD